MDFTRLAVGVGVDKHRAAALAEGLGKFRGKLMAGDDFHVLAGERLGKQAAGVPAKRIITPQWVAVADDQSPGSGVRSPESSLELEIRNSEFELAIRSNSPIFDFRLSIFGFWTPDSGLRTPDFFIHFSTHPTTTLPAPAIGCAMEPVRMHGWSN